jgi:hypothetical protein
MRAALATGLLGALLSLGALLPLGCGGVTLFDVERRQVLNCEIRPSGEFCDDPAGPLQQLVAVEHRGEHTVLVLDEETWVATGTSGERRVEKLERSTREPGPCTTTLSRVLTFDEDGEQLGGRLELTTRVEGPAACGETPRGDRQVFSLSGTSTNSI